MPSPSGGRRASRHRDKKDKLVKAKAVDVGVPLGPYDTNHVRDRVRQWQAQGGGVITASDIVVDAEDHEPLAVAAKRTVDLGRDTSQKPEDADTSVNEVSVTRERAGRRKSRVEDGVEDRERSGNAPKRRVVSDGHWRKKRSPPKRVATGQPGVDSVSSRPTKALLDDGIRVRAIPDENSRFQTEREGVEVTKRRRAKIDDGIRVYATLSESGSRAEPWGSRAEGHSRSRTGDKSDGEQASPGASSSPPGRAAHVKRGDDREPETGSSAAKEESRRRKSTHKLATPPERSPNAAHGAHSARRHSGKPHKVSILSQVFDEPKKLFSKPEPVAIQPPRIPTIEAWLSETPDPFVDGDTTPIATHTPATIGFIETKVSRGHVIHDDPNKIWDALGTTESEKVGGDRGGSRRRRRVRSAALYEDNPFPADLATEPPVDNPKTFSAAKLVDLLQDNVHPSPQSVEIETGTASNITSSNIASSSTVSSVEPCKPKSLARPPGLNRKRPFPSTGVHRLSTIASVETFQSKETNAVAFSDVSRGPLPTQLMDSILDSEAGDTFDPNSVPDRGTSLKRRLTTHADLISVLSVPRRGSKSLQSARSIRTNRSRLATATIGDLMKELSSDESKYMRELNTLVDGVIPVLLTCVLSKSDSVVAAGLFSPSANGSNDPSFTRPIVDMGIALERLKTLHKRIPHQDSRALLTWAQGAQRVYAEYIKAWRLGFQDVVINLAPAQEDITASPKGLDTHDKTLEDGLPRNKDGDVVNGDGERVDVAFLLKRPLVRLKYLSKTLKGVNFIMPSPEADNLAQRYQNLVIDARHRLNEEQARLEDEAASSIDPTRARDFRTLAPLIGVTIDRTRRVRARDYFNLALQHSSGQCVDCRVELLLRDDSPEKGTSSDLLICEVDSTGRWLLFPPIQLGRVSARNGDLEGEIVVMARGLHNHAQEWQETMAFRTDEEAIGFEWVQMLGLNPVPPQITRTQSFVDRQEKRKSKTASTSLSLVQSVPTTPVKSRTPSPREIDVPIGEQAGNASKKWTPTRGESENEELLSPVPIRSKERARLQKSPKSRAASGVSSSPSQLASEAPRTPPSQAAKQADRYSAMVPTPGTIDEALGLAESASSSGLRRAKAKRRSRHDSPASPRSPKSLNHDQEPSSPSQHIHDFSEADATASSKKINHETGKDKSPEPPSSGRSTIDRSILEDSPKQIRPTYQRRRSSVPSLELPSIPKIRKASPPTTPLLYTNEEPEWPVTPTTNEIVHSPAKLRKRRSDKQDNVSLSAAREEPPSPPVHRSPSPVQLKGSVTPSLASPTSAPNTKRRSSSPLKHEYEPSTASESSSDSDASTVDRQEVTSESDTSSEEELGEGDAPTSLLPLGALPRITKLSPQGSLYSLPNGTLTPSQSASQAPYKTVPAQPSKAKKSIASIFSWSDKGTWESLHPDECSIVITPGLIEVFEMSAAHSKPANVTERSETDSELSSISHESGKPLVAIELTPLVPLRRGTALDISVRSPPTANSKITSSSNIMFRSRNPEECENLYAHFNHSRINNPTYIALQNARGPYSESYNATLNRGSSTRGAGARNSWFGWGSSHKSSYRASSAPTPSIAASESSIGTMTTAFSALKRFGSSGRMFNIARSTITSRNGSRSNSIYSTDSSSGTSSPSPLASVDLSKGSPLGINNAKIRLYVRETASKWRDMGAGRLTIMRPLNAAHPPLSAAAGGLSPGGSGAGSSRAHGLHGAEEKRILVRGKTKGELLLDVCLGESSFERVARTGIALSVWEEVVGPGGVVGTVGAIGGVAGRRARVFMIQMKSEAETAYTFSIVGKLRY